MGNIMFIFSRFVYLIQEIFTNTRGYGEGYGMGPWMMWGYGANWYWPIIMIFFWFTGICLIFFLVRWLIMSTSKGRETTQGESALDILKKRYAKGEISK
jgi:uncharacterized membrane protein